MRWSPIENIYRRHREALTAEVQRKTGCSWHDSEDLLQNAVLLAAAGLDRIGSPSPQWLLGIAMNLALHLFRSTKRRCGYTEKYTAEPSAPHVGGRLSPVEDRIGAYRIYEELQGTLAAGDSQQQELVLRCMFDGLPVHTVAAMLGVPLSTAYKWRERARQRIQGMLDLEATHPDACGKHGRAPRDSSPPSQQQSSADPQR